MAIVKRSPGRRPWLGFTTSPLSCTAPSWIATDACDRLLNKRSSNSATSSLIASEPPRLGLANLDVSFRPQSLDPLVVLVAELHLRDRLGQLVLDLLERV